MVVAPGHSAKADRTAFLGPDAALTVAPLAHYRRGLPQPMGSKSRRMLPAPPAGRFM